MEGRNKRTTNTNKQKIAVSRSRSNDRKRTCERNKKERIQNETNICVFILEGYSLENAGDFGWF